MSFFTELEKNNPKLHIESQKPSSGENIGMHINYKCHKKICDFMYYFFI